MSSVVKHLARSLLALALPLASLRGAEPSPNVRFGLPSPAKPDPKQREDYLIEQPQYTLSYNAAMRRPNWACWRLRKADIGKAQRGPFEPDPLLPRGFAQVTSHAYDGSGFDRGHMGPAKDRSASQRDCDATFYLTNVVPQSPACDQKGWERLESYCRDLAHQGQVLYVACGSHGTRGTGKDGPKGEIGKGRAEVAVPAKVWKVVLVLPDEEAEPRRNTRVIAVIMPNDQTVGFDWSKYRLPVKEVEELTGYKFFPDVPGEVAAALKGRVDEVEIPAKATRPRAEDKKPE